MMDDAICSASAGNRPTPRRPFRRRASPHAAPSRRRRRASRPFVVATIRRAVARCWWFFVLLLAGPFLVGRFVYEATYNELKAGYDVATGTLGSAQAAAQRFGTGLAAGGQARRAERRQHHPARPAPASTAKARA